MDHLNLQRLDLASVRLVVLCAELGSLSEAAKRCHLSVSGASHRLTAFEEAMGFDVFVRHRRGLRVSARGARTVYCCTQLLSWASQLRAPEELQPSGPAAVDDEVLRGHHGAGVRGQEQRGLRDVLG
ncbi:MAG TPA: LysR family transcriptional regulator [Ramlibacter sp.]|nr:LysR family transcriptional regulator [Ramlibacter sp.]